MVSAIGQSVAAVAAALDEVRETEPLYLPTAEKAQVLREPGVLLCLHHHDLAHNPTYILTRHPDGSIRFHRRT